MVYSSIYFDAISSLLHAALNYYAYCLLLLFHPFISFWFFSFFFHFNPFLFYFRWYHCPTDGPSAIHLSSCQRESRHVLAERNLYILHKYLYIYISVWPRVCTNQLEKTMLQSVEFNRFEWTIMRMYSWNEHYNKWMRITMKSLTFSVFHIRLFGSFLLYCKWYCKCDLSIDCGKPWFLVSLYYIHRSPLIVAIYPKQYEHTVSLIEFLSKSYRTCSWFYIVGCFFFSFSSPCTSTQRILVFYYEENKLQYLNYSWLFS